LPPRRHFRFWFSLTCHHGCAPRSFLIVNGKSAGEVWRHDQTDEAGISPECGADGQRFGFLDWYQKLDASIGAT
ncbi:MAG TPA: hypothetical protein VE621_22170, partial [Bryobacteraceae bacterium]|nr:hypothetical protein [Bryobacteraceae bacterium]